MTKDQFIKELREKLNQLPEEEIYKSVSYYSELISDMVEDGLTEEEAVKSFGDVNKIAQGILQDVSFGTLVKKKIKPEKGWTPLTVILAIISAPIWISLLFAAGGIIFSVIATIAGLAIGLAGIVAALGITGIVLLVKAFSSGGAYLLISIGGGLILLAFFLLGILVIKELWKLGVKGLRKLYHKIRKTLIRKGAVK